MADQRERQQREAKKTSAADWAKQQSTGFDSKAIKLPSGVEFYKLEVGTHTVDFMPYLVGEGNKRADPGFIHFEREWAGHRIPGPDGRSSLYCCRWECFKRKCPACELMAGRTLSEEMAKALRATTRHLWLVNDKPGKAKNKLKVFDSNHFNRGMGFGEMLADAINSVPRYAAFADLKGGLSLQLTVKEQTFPGGKFNAVTRIDFIPRDYDYPDEVLENAPCLDDLLIDVGYEEMHRMLTMGEPSAKDKDDEEEEEKPTRRSVVSDDDDEEEEKLVSRKPVSRTDDDDEEEEKPVSRKPVSRTDDEDDDTNDEEETPKPAKGKSGKSIIKVGSRVTYKGSEYDVLKNSKGVLTLEDDEGDELTGIDESKVALVSGEEEVPFEDDEEDAPKAKKGTKTKDPDDEDDDDEPEPPKKGKGGTKAKAPPPDEDDDEDELELGDDEDEDDDDGDSDDEDDDDEPEPPKKAGKKRR